MKKEFESVLEYIAPEAAAALYMIAEEVKSSAAEIRLRAEKPVAVTAGGKTLFLQKGGGLTSTVTENTLYASAAAVEESFLLCCRHSVHTYESELSSCFVTLPLGARVGICGEQGEGCRGFRHVTSLNYRIPGAYKGAADGIKSILAETGGLVIGGPPASGKTTLVRECARLLSNGITGRRERVCLIDPRNELSATRSGRCGYDVGDCTDIMIASDTAAAVKNAIRVLSPTFIILDELMTDRELAAVEEGVGNGAAFIFTLHCGSPELLAGKRSVRRLSAFGALTDAVFISAPGAEPELLKLKSATGLPQASQC